jgi:DNA-binding CsgD family transcriptional regulator
MSGLSGREYRAAIQAVADICSVRRAEDFAAVVVSCLAALVPSDVVSVNLAGPTGLLALDEPLGTCSPSLRKELLRLLEDHPTVSYGVRSGDSSPYRMSDLRPLHQFSNTELYTDFYAKIGLRYELSFAVRCGPDQVLAIGLNRKTSDYTDRELALLRLVAPHIIRVQQHFRPTDDPRRARCAGVHVHLTARERDVLDGARAAKTNREIGTALGISSRTVQKHLENIFRKLNVHRRTAAALATLPEERPPSKR